MNEKSSDFILAIFRKGVFRNPHGYGMYHAIPYNAQMPIRLAGKNQ